MSGLDIAQNIHGCLCAPEGAVDALLIMFLIIFLGTRLSE